MFKIKFFKKALSLFLTIVMTCGIMVGFPLSASAAPVQTDLAIYRDTSYSFAERAADMVARMTMLQKTQQMHSAAPALLAGDDANGTISTGLRSYNWWRETLHGYTGASDVTSFPISFSMGQSWDPELMYRVATEMSDEIRERVPGLDSGLNFYSPTVNLSRDPRWGRNSESFGEDPLHSAMMGAQFVNGLQGFAMDGKPIDPNGYYKANATLKHYFANNTEDARLVGVANMTEQENREYYSAVYRELIRRTQPSSVMSAYNRIQIADAAYSPFKEIPGGINQYALDTLLRQTFGFRGYVTSDCDSVKIAVITSNNTDITGDGGTAKTSVTVSGGYGNGHGWREPAYNWYGQTGTKAAGTATIPYLTATGWAVMGGAELECQGGTPNSNQRYYELYQPNADAEASAAEITPFGKYTESAVDIACAELMEARLRVGEWDGKAEYTGAPSEAETSKVTWYDQAKARLKSYGINLPSSATGTVTVTADANTMTDARMDLVSEAAAKSMVLLKNDKAADVNGGQPLLPVTFPETGDFSVGVYGNNLRNTIFLGIYSSRRTAIGTEKQVNPVNGIRTALQDKFGDRVAVTDRGATSTVDAAGDDYVIAVVGDVSGTAAEQNDRANFQLSNNDIALIKDLYQQNKKLIVVILANCPIGEASITDNLYDSMPAMLFSSYLGDRPGEGIGDLIVGNVNPSARTNTTWYPISTAKTVTSGSENDSINPTRSYRLSPGIDGSWQSPFPAEGNPDAQAPAVPYTFTGPNRGRTYMYYNGTGDQAPLFPLGYGLSYTTFEYSNPKVYVNGVLQEADTVTVNPNDKIEYSFDVKNTGSVEGSDVAQFYVKTPADITALSDTGAQGQAYANKRLKDFKKTKVLAPGESQNITLSVEVPDLAFYINANKKFELKQGANNYVLQISRSSADSGSYNGQAFGAMLTRDMRINNAAGWNPKVSVVSFKPNTPADVINEIPQRLIFSTGDTVNPNPTVSMANDVLYGNINRLYSSGSDQQYPIPSNITITYTSNRPNVVSTAGGTIKAIGGGAATITGTAYDSITGSSTSTEFVVYVQGDALPYNVSLASVKADGLDAGISPDGAGYDVNLPAGSTTAPAIVATAAYPEDVDVVYTPPTSVPGTGKITVTSKTVPSYTQDYPVYFGYMSFGDLTNINYMGFNSDAKVRFSDGVTSYKLYQAFYKDGKLDKVYTTELAPIPKNEAGTVHAQTDDLINTEGFTIKVFLWDQDYKPLIPASSEWTEFD